MALLWASSTGRCGLSAIKIKYRHRFCPPSTPGTFHMGTRLITSIPVAICVVFRCIAYLFLGFINLDPLALIRTFFGHMIAPLSAGFSAMPLVALCFPCHVTPPISDDRTIE